MDVRISKATSTALFEFVKKYCTRDQHHKLSSVIYMVETMHRLGLYGTGKTSYSN